MPCPGPSMEDYSAPQPPNPARVVWAGRVDSNKRLDWLLNIAERLPAVQFEIAAAINTSVGMASQLVGRAAKLPNVIWRGTVPREKMPGFYRGATCLCCTSMHEGFPNIFIEAWSHGVPVVTTFEPDGLVTRLGLGLVAPDVAGLAQAIEKLGADRQHWLAASSRARDYYVKYHQVDQAMERFQAEFNRLACGNSETVETARPPAAQTIGVHGS
jgi:glycosyltransferase involved in cell wall biosynthesis